MMTYFRGQELRRQLETVIFDVSAFVAVPAGRVFVAAGVGCVPHYIENRVFGRFRQLSVVVASPMLLGEQYGASEPLVETVLVCSNV